MYTVITVHLPRSVHCFSNWENWLFCLRDLCRPAWSQQHSDQDGGRWGGGGGSSSIVVGGGGDGHGGAGSVGGGGSQTTETQVEQSTRTKDRQQANPAHQLIAKNFPGDITIDQIRGYFRQFGRLEDVQVGGCHALNLVCLHHTECLHIVLHRCRLLAHTTDQGLR